jgi:hypothetical protein
MGRESTVTITIAGGKVATTKMVEGKEGNGTDIDIEMKTVPTREETETETTSDPSGKTSIAETTMSGTGGETMIENMVASEKMRVEMATGAIENDGPPGGIERETKTVREADATSIKPEVPSPTSWHAIIRTDAEQISCLQTILFPRNHATRLSSARRPFLVT